MPFFDGRGILKSSAYNDYQTTNHTAIKPSRFILFDWQVFVNLEFGNLDFFLNTDLVFELHKAKQLGLEHYKKTKTRWCDHHPLPPPLMTGMSMNTDNKKNAIELYDALCSMRIQMVLSHCEMHYKNPNC